MACLFSESIRMEECLSEPLIKQPGSCACARNCNCQEGPTRWLTPRGRKIERCLLSPLTSSNSSRIDRSHREVHLMPAFKIVDMKNARVLASLVTMLIGVPCALSQESSQYDKGTPPQHAAGVSPLGSYTSSDLGTINLSNGALNMKLPLASVGGRGFSLPLTLNYSSKVWSASRDSNFADETGNHPVAYAEYADIENLMDLYSRVAPGWTIGAAPTLVVRGNGIKDNTTSICVGD